MNERKTCKNCSESIEPDWTTCPNCRFSLEEEFFHPSTS